MTTIIELALLGIASLAAWMLIGCVAIGIADRRSRFRRWAMIAPPVHYLAAVLAWPATALVAWRRP